MSTPLPDLANPWRLVQHSKEFTGLLASTAFNRLNEATLGVLGEVRYRLGFGRDDEGRAQITGHLEFKVRLECRRCLGPFVHEVDSLFSMRLVATEAEADALEDENGEVVVLADAPARLLDILEDEALLSLPPFPAHAPGDCALEMQQQLSRLAPRHEAKNPFSVLETLKKH